MSFQDVNYFSLLIPFFLFSTAILIFVLRLKKLVSIEMTWFGAAIFISALAQLIQTALLPNDLFLFAPFITLLFLISIVLCTHAVYKRLKIKTSWYFLTVILIITVSTVGYYSYIEQNLAVRFIAIALATIAILFNNAQPFINAKHTHILERLLKLSLSGSILAVSIRAVVLVSLIKNNRSLEDFPFIWASSQFLILFFTSLIFILLCACSIRDSIRKLEYERNIDPLTGLLNRRAFNEIIDHLEPHPNSQNALLICDIDHFKKINDIYGHYIGDLALQHVSHIMRKAVRRYDEIARIGGEEFVIFLQDTSTDTALCVAERIRETIASTPLKHDNHAIYLSISIGISFFQDQHLFQEALHQADAQLYQAKNLGRNQIQWTSAHLSIED